MDVVLLDLGLPDSDGLATLTAVAAAAPAAAVVVLRSLVDASLPAPLLLQHAQDELVKGEAEPALIVRSLRYAVDKAGLVREARELFDADLTGNFVATADGTLTDCNPAFARMLGCDQVAEADRAGARWRSSAAT